MVAEYEKELQRATRPPAGGPPGRAAEAAGGPL